MTTATPIEKPCSKCGEVKPLAEFHRRAASRDGHTAQCRACVAARYKAYRIANREQIATQKKAYREANAERIAARDRAYYEANRERALAHQKAYQAERWATDPEYRARRRAAKTRYYRLLASAKQEPYTREEIFERDGWVCGLCGEPIDPTIRYEDDPRACATLDHIVPLSRGGDDTPANVRASHFGCNSARGARVEHEDQEVAA